MYIPLRLGDFSSLEANRLSRLFDRGDKTSLYCRISSLRVPQAETMNPGMFKENLLFIGKVGPAKRTLLAILLIYSLQLTKAIDRSQLTANEWTYRKTIISGSCQCVPLVLSRLAILFVLHSAQTTRIVVWQYRTFALPVCFPIILLLLSFSFKYYGVFVYITNNYVVAYLFHYYLLCCRRGSCRIRDHARPSVCLSVP